MAHVIARSGMKAHYASLIRLGRSGFNLPAKSLDRILYRTLHNEIGLKSEKVAGSVVLGVSFIVVWFTDLRSLPAWMK